MLHSDLLFVCDGCCHWAERYIPDGCDAGGGILLISMVL